MSLGFEQDRDDAFLINEIALAIDSRTTRVHSAQEVATGLLAVNEDCRLTLPIFKQCLDTDDEQMRIKMVHAVIRSVRDLLSIASTFEGSMGVLPSANDTRISAMTRAAWYPFNALSVLACWHYETADRDSPVAVPEYYFNSPLWDFMIALCGHAGTNDSSLPETLSWAAGHPAIETIKSIVEERKITSREDIEYLLESQGHVTAPVRNGVL